jgi:predicted NUDIX family NTP pyrophosphohydrolase
MLLLVKTSAGLLPFRRRPTVQVLIAHPGGPFFAGKDAGHWSVVKGEVNGSEDLRAAASREFTEETGWPAPAGEWIDLGMAWLRSGKRVVVWGVEATFEPDTLAPGTFELHWHGRRQRFPEIDLVRWCDPATARRLLNPGQAIFIERLLDALG